MRPHSPLQCHGQLLEQEVGLPDIACNVGRPSSIIIIIIVVVVVVVVVNCCYSLHESNWLLTRRSGSGFLTMHSCSLLRCITLRAKLSGAVYCNRPCLFACVFVCGSVTTITRIACIDLHQTGSVCEGSDHLELIKFWPSGGAPGKGVCGGTEIFGYALLQPARSVCVSLSAFSYSI